MSFFDGILKAGGVVLDELGKTAQQRLQELSGQDDWSANFEHVAAALSDKCVQWRRLSQTAFDGEFECKGESVTVNAFNLEGKATLVCGDPIRLSLGRLSPKVAAYLLIRSGMSPYGAWTAREAGGMLELRFFARVPMKIADRETLGEAILGTGFETLYLHRHLDG